MANSTPIVVLDSILNSFLVKRIKRFDLPTPESPVRGRVSEEKEGSL